MLEVSLLSWLTFAFGMALMFGLTLIGATHLRLRYGRKSIAILSLSVGLAVLGGLTAFAGWASFVGWRAAHTLANPPALATLKPDWGADFSAANRMKYSLMLAETAFVYSGALAEYFDLQGKRVTFEPNEKHRAQRDDHLAQIRSMKTGSSIVTALAIVCLLLASSAIWLSRTKLAHQIVEAERRIEAGGRQPS